MLLPCTQERRQTVVAAHQPPGRVPESARSLGLWRLLRRSRAPTSSAPRLEGPPAGAAATCSAGAGGGNIEPHTAASAMARHASYSWARAAALAPWFTGACPATLTMCLPRSKSAAGACLGAAGARYRTDRCEYAAPRAGGVARVPTRLHLSAGLMCIATGTQTNCLLRFARSFRRWSRTKHAHAASEPH